jgi:hypothetical protein
LRFPSPVRFAHRDNRTCSLAPLRSRPAPRRKSSPVCSAPLHYRATLALCLPAFLIPFSQINHSFPSKIKRKAKLAGLSASLRRIKCKAGASVLLFQVFLLSFCKQVFFRQDSLAFSPRPADSLAFFLFLTVFSFFSDNFFIQPKQIKLAH